MIKNQDQESRPRIRTKSQDRGPGPRTRTKEQDRGSGEMLKHCPSLRMERGEGRISIHNQEDVELGGKMRIVDLKEGGISEQERSKYEE